MPFSVTSLLCKAAYITMAHLTISRPSTSMPSFRQRGNDSTPYHTPLSPCRFLRRLVIYTYCSTHTEHASTRNSFRYVIARKTGQEGNTVVLRRQSLAFHHAAQLKRVMLKFLSASPLVSSGMAYSTIYQRPHLRATLSQKMAWRPAKLLLQNTYVTKALLPSEQMRSHSLQILFAHESLACVSFTVCISCRAS